jgi:demethylmenaquinone methyltransferase/2-methoxy-6-polyprenyl-1,4-benzoquinol methylase
MEKHEWRALENQLARIIRVYERMNKAMSLGLINGIRAEAASRLCEAPEGLVLDAGSGPGTMTETLLKLCPEREAVLLDPLEPMLREARLRHGGEPHVHLVQGVMEHLPFRDNAFAAIVTAFSLRDTMDMRSSLREIGRVLRPGGLYLFLDLSKPESRLLEKLFGIYLRFAVPLMALLIARGLWREYLGLYNTYRSLPPTTTIAGWVREAVGEAIHEPLLWGTVSMILARKTGQGEEFYPAVQPYG